MVKAGTVLGGKYEILKKIGQGGMSIVYLALDMHINKQWAVKEISREKSKASAVILKGFQMETNVLKMVDHPVLPRIIDIIYHEDSIFVIMDYIEGRPLSEILKSEGAQPQHSVIEWAKDLCSALEYLHSMRPPIIYRDMKPSNIMVKPDGKVKLIDFGTAKEFDEESTADTTALGTRGYAAPEQFGDAKGKGLYKTDARTDIYSLGVTLYHVLTGKSPCEPPYVFKPIRNWNPKLSGGVEKIVNKCIMPNPEDRYQTCTELIYDLEHYEKLDDAFRKMCFRKVMGFLFCVGLTFSSIAVSIGGYAGIMKERKQNYENLISDGYSYTIQGKYEAAAHAYMTAITEVDGGNYTAYIELMDLYINYIGDTEAGLNKVSYYVDQGYQNIDKNPMLILSLAINYFDVLRDYKSSAYYFNLLDKERYPEAVYYSSIALAMSKLEVDYSSLLDNLNKFEIMNDNAVISINKLMNYRLLCIVYARNLKQINAAANNLVRVANRGLQLLEDYDDDSIKAEYYTVYNQYLTLAYEHLGNTEAENDMVKAEGYYNEALACCDFILGMISADDIKTLSNITDIALREAKYCQKAKIYENLRKYEEACKVYERAEKEYNKASISLYTGHLFLLCKMQEEKTTDIEQWDYSKLYALYQEGRNVPHIENDYRWKQLIQKLSPLFEKNGG